MLLSCFVFILYILVCLVVVVVVFVSLQQGGTALCRLL